MTAGLQLGAPGVYFSSQRAEPAFQPVRLDIPGFAGVALRGPVDTPTLVTSWTDYQRRFGGFESPRGMDGPDRLLPYGVQAFFDQGGDRAYVLRVAPPAGADGGTEATARYELAAGAGGPARIAAANEGSWGSALSIQLDFAAGQSFQATAAGPASFVLPDGAELHDGSLLRIRCPGLPPAGVFRWARQSIAESDGIRLRIARLSAPLEAAAERAEIAVITGVLLVQDSDPSFARQERITALGLHPDHPRYIGRVLAGESFLVAPDGHWRALLVPPGPLLPRLTAELIHPGSDRWNLIDYGSFFDSGAAADDPLDEQPHRGVDALGRVSEIGLLCAPDLQWRWQGSAIAADPPSRPPGTGRFGLCAPDVAPTVYAPHPAPPAQLDARDPGQLLEIIHRQRRLVEVAGLRRRFIALVDVPAGLPVTQITGWRALFDSSFAAAYHPWLGVPRAGDRLGRIVPVPPSSFAAGIIAARERGRGLPWGPANVTAIRAVTSGDSITDAVHDQLHVLGINVYRAERDGFRLSAARTMSSDPQYRQLSVRRLMTMISLALERQSQWLVFEPNTPGLRELLLHSVTQFLRDLYLRQAFAGDTEAQSFFVRCDDELNTPQSQALGRLIAEVGVAPSSPLEYLVLRISQDADGGVVVSSGG